MRLFLTIILASLSLAVTWLPATPAMAATTELHPGCILETDGKGVLIKGTVKEGGFNCYLYALLQQNMVYIVLIAIVLVVFSGIEYMYAVGNSANQAKAKTRILGIVAGLIFYFLIQYITRITSTDLKL